MKQTIYILLAVTSLILTGCDDPSARAKEKSANPTFMFWCFRKEIISNTYHIPDMTTQKIATYIQNRFKRIPGYDSSSYDLESKTMIVSYKSSTVRKMNFEEAIAQSGFSVNNRPADPKAKIPEGVK